MGSGKSPTLSLKEVDELGDTRAIANRLTPFADYNELVGLPDAMARKARFTRV